jgi:ATP-dependent Clp protease ATP-binding subunit ClpX
MTTNSITEICNFCGKHKNQTRKLIIGDEVAICNECVEFCQTLLIEEQEAFALPDIDLNPISIKKFLDLYIIAQDAAKIVISVAISNHYKRIDKKAPIEIEKSNILCIGPTGCGKTMLARTMAKYLNVPFAIADATSITESGYVGDDVETLIQRLLNAANGDISKAEHGIIFIDEIDKISRRSESANITRDVSGEGVQQALLKIIEGTNSRVNLTGNRKHPSGEIKEVDTKNILFIAGGAFIGLEKIIDKRLNHSTIGFGSRLVEPNDSTSLKEVTPADLQKYGLIPELIGRFTTTVALDELNTKDLTHILTNVKNNLIDQYKYLFQLDNVELEITEDAIERIVIRTQELKTGARGLHSELERTLIPHMYNIYNYKDKGIKHLLINNEQVDNPEVLTKQEGAK